MSNGVRSLNEEEQHQDKYQYSNQLLLPNCGSNHSPDCRITHVDVFLGSLTFTSEQLAFSLAEKAKLRGAVVTVQSLDEFQPEQYIDSSSLYRVAVFVVSTHAAGKSSPNAEKFLQWLRKTSKPFCSPTKGPPQLQVNQDKLSATRKLNAGFPAGRPLNANDQSPRTRQITATSSHSQDTRSNFQLKWRSPFGRANSSKTLNKPDEPLRRFQYAVFGMGNSNYRTFNTTAKYVDERLQELGAVSVCPLGLGDVSKCVETTFESWETHLLQMISASMSTCTPPSLDEPSRLLPVHRASLLCAATNTKTIGNIPQNDLVHVGDIAKRGPTLADLELPLRQQLEKTRQR